AGLWLYWRKRLAPMHRFEGIRNVAVVGAGWGGIYSVRWLNEAGLQVTCFEATDSLGGIWKYRPDRAGGVFESTRVTSSKHFLHACDFPLPSHSPEFPHRSQVFTYLQSYVDHFGIRERFRLNTQVRAVVRDGERWRVVTQPGSGEPQEEIFDAVVVCSGPHQNPNIDPAQHPLYSRFTGRIIHSAEYKKGSDIGSGKNVLVVGAGESAADIVPECVQEGAVVHWA